jgi:hypothetical protein
MLNELVQRDRMEKVAMWEATVRAVGLFMGHSPEAVSNLVVSLKIPLMQRVSQEAYNMRGIREKLYDRLKTIRTKDKYMGILDEMTV